MTKKEFKKTLVENENVLVAVGSSLTQMPLKEKFIRDAEGTLNDKYKVEWRTCIEEHSTYLLFSDYSRLYLDEKGTFNYYEVVPNGTENYFKVKKYLVREYVHGNGYNYIVYAIR